MAGWISIHRKLQEHWIWDEKPFDKRSAWIDLLMMVNHEDKKILLGKEFVEVKRGSRITSIRKLCDRWGWSNTKVKSFLSLLEQDNMLIAKSDTKKTIITIVNYNDYQVNGDDKNDTKTPPKHQENDTETSRKHTNNNDNNDNKNSLCMYDENLKQIINLLENNLGVVAPILRDEIHEYSKTFDLEMFSEAIKIAANNKKRTVNYVLGILRKWKDSNTLTIDHLQALRKEKEIEIENKKQKYKDEKQSYPKPKKTRFHNFEQRTDKYSNDDLEDVVARKRREHSERLRKAREAL